MLCPYYRLIKPNLQNSGKWKKKHTLWVIAFCSCSKLTVTQTHFTVKISVNCLAIQLFHFFLLYVKYSFVTKKSIYFFSMWKRKLYNQYTVDRIKHNIDAKGVKLVAFVISFTKTYMVTLIDLL